VIVSHYDSNALIRCRYHDVHLPTAWIEKYEARAAIGVISGKRDGD
jgi:hypothetical protein